MMRKYIILKILVIIVSFPALTFSAPILPEDVDLLFKGTFRIEDALDNLVEEIPISGRITFTLNEQLSTSFTYLDYVFWGFSGTTYDGLLEFGGGLDNMDAIGMSDIPLDASALAWGPGNWDSAINEIDESYTNISWGDNFCPFCGEESGVDWNLINNDNFLPDEIQDLAFGGTIGEDVYMGVVDLNLSPAPVPEPSTILLLGSGLLGLAGFTRKFRA